jgi:hypothetical protein
LVLGFGRKGERIGWANTNTNSNSNLLSNSEPHLIMDEKGMRGNTTLYDQQHQTRKLMSTQSILCASDAILLVSTCPSHDCLCCFMYICVDMPLLFWLTIAESAILCCNCGVNLQLNVDIVGYMNIILFSNVSVGTQNDK